MKSESIAIAQRALSEWFVERRKRIASEQSARGLEQLRAYRDELRRYLAAGGDDAPQLRALRAQHARVTREHATATAKQERAQRVKEARDGTR